MSEDWLRPTLSVAIITYNEQGNIPACLDSVSDLADEIIVLDSFSTDRTEEVCRANPKVKFSQNPFGGHVEQKNLAIQLCSGDWILSLDADERLTPELREAIKSFLSSNPPAEVAGARFARLNRHLHKDIRHGGWYPNARYRLFRKGRARWGGENPHDKLILDGRGVMLAGDLLHFSFQDLAHQVQTINNFSSIAALMRYNRGVRFRVWRLLVKPVGKFLEIYLAKRGFLDGIHGMIIAVSSAYSTFLKEAKLFELDRLGSGVPSNLPSRYEKKGRVIVDGD
ncbi:MAG: glycosyl transferase [Desulfuromonas sp.]|nr:MAG: glycosyl transferase [Desulfuromonas sp.]